MTYLKENHINKSYLIRLRVKAAQKGRLPVKCFVMFQVGANLYGD